MWPITGLLLFACTVTSSVLSLSSPSQVVARVQALAQQGDLNADDEYQLAAFTKFIFEQGRQYSDDEEIQTRFELFKEHGKQFGGDYGFSWTGDLTLEEVRFRTGLVLTGNEREDMEARRPKLEALLSKVHSVPEEFDWRKQGAKYLAPIANQGHCGSCWAFAYSGIMESYYAIHHKTKAETLSKSELVECSWLNETAKHTCVGGGFDDAFNYTKRFGLETEEEYPYSNGDTIVHECQRKNFKKTKVVTLDYVIANTTEEMQKLLITQGPLYVVLNSKLMNPDLKSQIIRKNDEKCCPHALGAGCFNKHNAIDHGVIMVGYGTEDGVPYWILRNSWGENFGEKGYFRMERGSNTCGVEDNGAYAVMTT